jgi:hypothetical protein
MLTNPPFEHSSLAPTFDELKFIYESLLGRKFMSVLEFGCGVTTWAIYSAIADSGWADHKDFSYVSIEHFEPCIQSINTHIPKVKMYNTVWGDLPRKPYDLVFIDSSAGYKPSGEDTGIHRKEAMVFAENLLAPNAYVIIHDYHRPQGGHKALRSYLDNHKKFALVSFFNNRSGVGIYRKI